MPSNVFFVRSSRPFFDIDAVKLAQMENLDAEVHLVETREVFSLLSWSRRKKYKFMIKVSTTGWLQDYDDIYNYQLLLNNIK